MGKANVSMLYKRMSPEDQSTFMAPSKCHRRADLDGWNRRHGGGRFQVYRSTRRGDREHDESFGRQTGCADVLSDGALSASARKCGVVDRRLKRGGDFVMTMPPASVRCRGQSGHGLRMASWRVPARAVLAIDKEGRDPFEKSRQRL
jgi:hypothetical protein